MDLRQSLRHLYFSRGCGQGGQRRGRLQKVGCDALEICGLALAAAAPPHGGAAKQGARARWARWIVGHGSGSGQSR
eukprot:CAMPEP_0170404966 /NCGR_PEP_ID=MMETSP0117_2-20130122/26922_1 /TAXON_ID=400756 /ORGANISM="Durinskia baltica, Strain CSIRO CS-38" /LENGTH=75 /DNA_ID=CAMNT_0010662035 /DNA_START=135 /DNA_END=358 /DNA_ORIENTATION=+